MSHHLDSPLARQDPRLDLADQFVFPGDRSTVLVMDVNTSLAGATPGFHPEGRYEFKVHLDGEPRERLCYRFTFEPVGPDGNQAYAVERLSGAEAADDGASGAVVASGTSGAEVTAGSGLRVWAGRAEDPFYLDLKLLQAIDAAVQQGESLDVAAWSEPTTSTFAGSQVYSIVVEVPHSDAELRPDRDIAVWSTTKLATDSGGWRQVNRAGLPMIWPIFRADGSDEASQANQTHPADDVASYREAIAALVASVVERAGTSTQPLVTGADVSRRITPDLLPYRVGSPAAFSFAGFNGRMLGDNAPEVMFSLVTNSAIPTGLTPASTASLRTDRFPYVVPSRAQS